MKYPTNHQTFEEIRKGGYVYVDKTEYIYTVIHESMVNVLSRPKCFGKSLLISTMEAYFEGKKELFEGLAIEKLEKDWVKRPIIKFDFSEGDYTKEGGLMRVIDAQLSKYEKLYGGDPENRFLGDRFWCLMRAAAEKTGQRIAILVDDYDKPVRDALGTPLEEDNKNEILALYQTLKAAYEYFRFVLLTGNSVLIPNSRYSNFINYNDISYHYKYTEMCGFTEEEIDAAFGERIKEIAKEENRTAEEIKQELKDAFGGYLFNDRKETKEVYNPEGVLKAMENFSVKQQWFPDGTPEYMIRLLQTSKDVNLKEYAGRSCDGIFLYGYNADEYNPRGAMYHSGYLTKTKNNERRRSFDDGYILDYPNQNVRRSLDKLIEYARGGASNR